MVRLEATAGADQDPGQEESDDGRELDFMGEKDDEDGGRQNDYQLLKEL